MFSIRLIHQHKTLLTPPIFMEEPQRTYPHSATTQTQKPETCPQIATNRYISTIATQLFVVASYSHFQSKFKRVTVYTGLAYCPAEI